jgi:hypothetical protein
MLQGADDESKKIRDYSNKDDDRNKASAKPKGKVMNAETSQMRGNQKDD